MFRMHSAGDVRNLLLVPKIRGEQDNDRAIV